MPITNRQSVARHDIIPGLLRPGLSLLTGDPAAGMSDLAVHLAVLVAGGCRGQVIDLQAKVLYLAQEDSLAHAHACLRQLAAPDGLALCFGLYWPPLDAGGLDHLGRELDSGGSATKSLTNWSAGVPARSSTDPYRLVVVNTLTHAVSPLARRSPSCLLRILEQLHVLAATHGLSLLLVNSCTSRYDAVGAAFAEAGRRNLFDRTLTLTRPRGSAHAIERAHAELALSDSTRPIILPIHAGVLS